MARLRRRPFPRTGASLRRRTAWDRGPNGTLAPASSASVLFGTAAEAAEAGLTIVRMRGEFTFGVVTALAALDGFTYGVGICIVSQNAAGVGITAVPSPVTDNDWGGWMWHHLGEVRALSATESEFLANPLSAVRIMIDSKAMRKVNVTDNVVAVLETAEVGTATGHARLDTRLLAKLP